jgi:hypothetical protein
MHDERARSRSPRTHIRRNADCFETARAARPEITDELNQWLRRLRQYRSEGEWVSAVLDGASWFVHRIAVFGVNDGALSLRGQHELNLPEQLSFPVMSGGAFASAIASKDSVIALRTRSEVGEALSSSEPGERVCVVPIANGSRVAAVLFGIGEEDMNVNALELIAGIASAVLERRSNASIHTQVAVTAAIEKGNPFPETPNSTRS